MCVTSAVMDQYSPWFPNQWPHTVPYRPNPYVRPDTQTTKETIIIKEQPFDVEAMRELIDSFTKALEAAETFDRLTGQPDCVDPEKAELLQRVADLEARLDDIAEAAKGEDE